jgi:hypothetical protein
MSLTVIIIIAVGMAGALVAAALRARALRAKRHEIAASEAALRPPFADYQASVHARSDRLLEGLPDDEWLAVIKARAEHDLRRHSRVSREQEPVVTYKAMPWEVVELAAVTR